MKMDKKIDIIILCGGKGKRLHPITNDIPKPLLKIRGKPILSYIIDHLGKYNLDNLIITTGYNSSAIQNYINTTYQSSLYKINQYY